jgi:PAS domain S-box-containing protein
MILGKKMNDYNKNKIQLVKELQELRKKRDLSSLLLDSLPHPTMLISNQRIVLAANTIAQDMGVNTGDYCWRQFGKCESLSAKNKKLAELDPHTPGIQCTFCQADELFNGKDRIRRDSNIVAFGRQWDTYWVKLNSNIFLHYAIDITKHVKLDSEKTMLAYAIKSIRECVSVTDTEDKIIFVNDAFLKTYGYKRSELIGKSMDIVKSANNPPEIIREILPKTLKGGWTGEIINRKKDGSEFPVSLSTSVIHRNNGHPDTLIGVAIDITQRRELETLLQQSQKLEAIGQLAGGVAHDFNNLLTIINGYSSILLSELYEEDKIYKDIKQIHLAGLRAGSLTEQLLAFSRKQIVKPDILNLNLIVKENKKMLQRIIGEDIAIQLHLEENIGCIKADAGQINQIIMNLLVNARDAMPDGGQLTIETKNQEIDAEYSARYLKAKPGKYIVLSISDNGIGMDKQTKTRIFEPFFTTKEIGKGTGLGLATVYGIVKQNEGYIRVYSEPGNGTTFNIYLPHIEEDFIVQDQENPSLETLHGTETVLLVEDELEVCQLTVEILQNAGYRVLKASHGKEAIEVIKNYNVKVHLLISDVIMPEMNGKKLADNLLNQYSDLKVIFISGYTGEAISRSGILKKGTIFLQKPFSPHALLKLVRKTLDGKLKNFVS